MTGARALSNIARVWLTTLACVIAAPRGGVPSPSTKIADIASKGADADGLRQAFERATYSLEKCGQGMWRGVNPAQQFTVEFKGGDVTLSHPDGGIAFHLTGYGYGSELRTPQRASLTGNGDFLTLNRGGLAEWYRNGPQGLEQGFTLSQRSGANSNSEPLVIALGFAGALRAVQNSYDGAIFLESGKGVVLRYGGLKAVDARGRVLPSRIEVRDQEIRLIVQDHDAQYPLVVDPIWSQQQELTASDGLAGDYFGQSVAVSGDTAVIGAYRQNGSQGAAYVFVRSGGAWSLQQKLTASDGQELDQFGVSVSVNGDTAVIGAYGRNFYQGAAYVFVRSGVTWTQQQELTASDSAVNDDFGISVSVNANTALIGAFGNNSSQGAAYVFVSGGGVWSQQQELSASDGAASDSFGDSVSVTGNTALIAADGKNSKQGAAYVFAYDGTTWSQQQELTASDGVASDSFGNSVSLGANVAVIGADGRGSNQGAAYVFGLSGGTWSQQQELSASDGVAGDQFGYAVSLSGYTALVGAPAKNNLEGAAYVFAFTAGVWSQQQELTASDGATSDVFGISVSASGNTALVGATGNNSSQGAAYAFVAQGTRVTLTPGITGGGAIAANPLPSGGTYLSGTYVCLTAVPGTGWLFGAWSGAALDSSNCLVMSSDASVTATFTTPAEFNDVDPPATYSDAANLMFEAGVTTGCIEADTPQNRSYCPNDNVTRQEMAAFIVRAVTGTVTPVIYNPAPYFQDVPNTNPFFPHIQKLMDLGITTGCSQSPALYCPTDTIPRWEMAIFMVRARLLLYGASFTSSPTPYFADVPTNVEGNGMPFPFIQRAYEEAVTHGCAADPLIFCPDEIVTRGQMASFVMRGLFNETMVLGPTAPFLAAVTPNAVAPTVGDQITVNITGANTSFQTGDTVSVPSGMLDVSNVVVNSTTSITATLTVNGTAVAGPQALVVTSGGQNLTLPLAIKMGTY